MKNIFYIICAALVIAPCFMGCNKNEEAISQQEKLVVENFNRSKIAASYHSQGLEFAYQKLKKLEISDKAFSKRPKAERFTLIDSSIKEFTSQKHVISAFSQLDNQIHLKTFEKQTLRSDGEINFTPEVIKLLEYFDKIVDRVVDISSIEPIILTAIKSEEFASFSEEEQNTLLMMLAVYQDSANYWEKNFDEWKELLGENDANSGLRAAIVIEDLAAIEETSLRNGWKADGAGALGGLLGGALFGSSLGPAGTVVGAVGGALEGAIVGSLMNLFLPVISTTTTTTTISSQALITSINNMYYY